jgi:hypothetical protein
MNKTESALTGFFAGCVIMFVTWMLWSFWIFENLMAVLPHFSYDLTPVKNEFYWLGIGIYLLWSAKAATRLYHYSRRGEKV